MNRIITGLGHLGYLVMSRSSRSHLLYKVSRSDLDSHALTVASGANQNDELNMLSGNVFPDSHQDISMY